ncbi:hypothetical protein KC865_01075 [Candidatus Kaiserbacteria bacterium]|nr:hypothetical protein [Candidatus Kaiserbacteria bacterium]USN92550.1 MAG: hypothetical protein H6782_01910 [Candidatus Nomurabacteria bacterium]
MQEQSSKKVVGATIIGFALVALAYTVGNFGERKNAVQPASVRATSPVERVSIEVTDNDNNGIEDWRDQFVTTAPVVLDKASSTYVRPETLTGKMSIDFMENIIRSRGYGEFGRSDEEVISDTVNYLVRETADKLYGKSDITIMEEWDDQDIVNYANTVAATLYRHNIPNMDSELTILNDIVKNKEENRVVELKSLMNAYRNYRDDTLKIPVPKFLAKEHLDLINTYHAVFKDIEAMSIALEDPVVSLLRLKRYEDDATGLGYALKNMYLALEPHAGLFTTEDPAVLFVIFSPDYQL